MAKKNRKQRLADLIKELNDELENQNLTKNQREAYIKLKEILESENIKPKATLKTFILLIIGIIMILLISYLLSFSLFGFMISFISVKNWYSLLWISAILAGLHLITGGIDLKRMGYDKLYLESRIVITTIKIVVLMLLNTLVIQVFNASAIWILYVIIFELLTTYMVQKLVF